MVSWAVRTTFAQITISGKFNNNNMQFQKISIPTPRGRGVSAAKAKIFKEKYQGFKPKTFSWGEGIDILWKLTL